MRPRGLVVAIDGPAGSGKSTAARRVAEELGYSLVDTGAIYRTVALLSLRAGLSPADGPAIALLAERTSIQLARGGRVFLDGSDVSEAIRAPLISSLASKISALPEVRAALLGLQRALGREGGVVLEGRDIGTVVFPDAELKVFLCASPEVRARRRYEELCGRGLAVSFSETLREVEERDARDSLRAIAPLCSARDSVVLDSSDLTLDEVVDQVVALARARLAELQIAKEKTD